MRKVPSTKIPSSTKRVKNITVKGAKENNLKDITVDFPLNKFIVVTGVSGSGKSSLVMDVLYAEGQRRFAESMTSYTRQFLANARKPSVEYIQGLCPTIAIKQKTISTSSKSTVGTLTEIQDYIRLIYARLGKIHSPVSGAELKFYSPTSIALELTQTFENKKAHILYSIDCPCDEELKNPWINSLLQKGFYRIYQNEKILDLEDIDTQAQLNKTTYVLVDRITISQDEDTQDRMKEALHIALYEGRGEASVHIESHGFETYSNRLQQDNITYQAPTPSLFSHHSPHGICPTCSGYGTALGLDSQLIIPHPHLSLYEGAVAPWRGVKMSEYLKEFIQDAASSKFPIHKPINKLSKKHQELLWHGEAGSVCGIYPFFDIIKKKSHKIQYRVMLSRYQSKVRCPECDGSRLRKEALYIKLKGRHIGELASMTIMHLKKWLESQKWNTSEKQLVERLLGEVHQRIDTLFRVGLSYLTLNRAAPTLSGGESQRIQLTKFLGSNLTQSLYLLDEPSIGLHYRDTANLIRVLKQLRDLGNTVIVVEHDEDIIRSADHIIDMGPLAGRQGGQVVSQGTLSQVIKSNSLTAQYLKKEKIVTRLTSYKGMSKTSPFIVCRKASLFNLNNVEVLLPINRFSVLCGPSGSGKSTLMQNILYPALCKKIGIELQGANTPTGSCQIELPKQGIENIEWMSQRAIARFARSSVVSYTKIYDDIRILMAKQPSSKQKGITASAFSFNTAGGRCEECKGEGVKTIEMQFLPSVKLTCEECKGKRFSKDVLSVEYQGKNINDLLNMSVEDAQPFFAASASILNKLNMLSKAGIGYVKLGQSTATLSGGELQRLKLAAFLTAQKNKPTLFLLDEPTIGLHFDDVANLVRIFDELLQKTHTIVVIEHNQDIIKNADWIVELGPKSGGDGGKVMYCGARKNKTLAEKL